MINTINAMLTTLSDYVLSLLAGWPPLLTLVVISAVAGVLMTVVFRFTSPQHALQRVAALSRAHVLAIKLFKDDTAGMFRSLGNVLRYTALRLWYSLPPVMIMIPLFVMLMSQLARWYEHRPLVPGDRAVVELQLAPSAWSRYRDVALEPSEQIAVEIRPLRDEAEHTVYWRIRAIKGEPATICWRLGARQVDMRISLADDERIPCAVDPRRAGVGWGDQLLHPGQPGFEDQDPVRGIVVHYGPRSTPLFGLDVPWWLTFVVVSILAALLARPVIKVTF